MHDVKQYLHLHLSRSHGDRWGDTDIATLFHHLILFPAFRRASQNCSPFHLNMLFSQCFFSVFLPPCTVPCKIFLQALLILMRSQTVLTCVSLSSVMWFLYAMPSSLLKHLISVACNFFRRSAVYVQVSKAFNSTDITRERISLIFKLRELCVSFQMVFSLASAAAVSAILHSNSGLER